MEEKEFQESWDRELLTRFFSAPDMPMWMFEQRMGGKPSLRGVKENWQYNQTICRFVCEAMPKVGDMMWKLGKDGVGRIIDVLKNSQLDSRAAVSTRTKDESHEKHSDKRNFRYTQLNNSISLAAREKATSGWDTVKHTSGASRAKRLR